MLAEGSLKTMREQEDTLNTHLIDVQGGQEERSTTMPSESRIRQPLGIMTRMITPRGRGGPTALPMQIERTVQSTNGFRLFWLRRATVIKLVRFLMYLTIIMVMTATALLLWGMIVNGMEVHLVAWWTAGIAVAVAVPISLHEILMHMLHYVQPKLQRYYIRILWMVPIFAIESWMALRFKDQAMWLETLRECYEAYVVYSFFRLMLHFLGAEEGVALVLRDRERQHARLPWPFQRVTSWRYRDGSFVENCRVGVFFFVFVRLICAVVSLLMAYLDGMGGRYLYVKRTTTVLINLAQLAALTSLGIFYYDLKQELAPLRPLGKFLAVKAVVFFSFWQGMVLYVLGKSHLIHSSHNYSQEEVSKGLQDYLLCWEMAVAAVAHTYVFSYTDFQEHFDGLSDHVKRSHIRAAMHDMIVQHDFAQDTVYHMQSAVSRVLPSSLASPFPSTRSSSQGSVSTSTCLPFNSMVFASNSTIALDDGDRREEDDGLASVEEERTREGEEGGAGVAGGVEAEERTPLADPEEARRVGREEEEGKGGEAEGRQAP